MLNNHVQLHRLNVKPDILSFHPKKYRRKKIPSFVKFLVPDWGRGGFYVPNRLNVHATMYSGIPEVTGLQSSLSRFPDNVLLENC